MMEFQSTLLVWSFSTHSRWAAQHLGLAVLSLRGCNRRLCLKRATRCHAVNTKCPACFSQTVCEGREGDFIFCQVKTAALEGARCRWWTWQTQQWSAGDWKVYCSSVISGVFRSNKCGIPRNYITDRGFWGGKWLKTTRKCCSLLPPCV